jgi:hypothetical protein
MVFTNRNEDPNGTSLTYRLDDDSLSKGITLDHGGRLRWTPSIEDIGDHTINLDIADSSGATTRQTFTLTVAADTTAPKVELLPLTPLSLSADETYQANLGDEMRWQVAASDNVGITGLQLFINGDPLALDVNGTAVLTAAEASTLCHPHSGSSIWCNPIRYFSRFIISIVRTLLGARAETFILSLFEPS